MIEITKKGILKRFIYSLVVLLIYLILYLFKVPCFFKSLTGIPCPGCGMTRALISIVKLDFIKAFNYHPMVYLLPFMYVYYLLDGRLFKKEIINRIFAVIILIGFIGIWIIRLIMKLI